MNPVTQINFFAIKPEKIDEFIEANRKYAASVSPPKGLIASRLYRGLDGKSAVRVSQFESIQALDEIRHSETLRHQIDKLRPLIESSSPVLYEEVSTTGEFR